MNSSVLRNPKKRPQVATHGTGANTKAAITVELPEVRTAEQKWANAGQIMSVFCSDPRYRDLSGQVLYFKFMLALALGQYAILRKSMRIEDTEEVMPGPVGAIHWAKVSEQLHQQFFDRDGRATLGYVAMGLGQSFWIIDAPGDPRQVG